jgi:hypothetical protein
VLDLGQSFDPTDDKVYRYRQLVRLRSKRYAWLGLGALTAMPKRPRR